MSSSIFNFDVARRYARLPLRERAWHATVLAVLLATFAATRAVTARVAAHARVNYITEARKALSPATRVLFVGNSHFYSGIRPDRFAFEAMSVVGSGFNYQILEAVLRKNLDRLPGVRLAVIAFDANPLLNSAAAGDSQSTQLLDWGLSRAEVPGSYSPGLEARFRRLVASPERLSPEMVLGALGLRPPRVVAGHLPSDDRFTPPKARSWRIGHHARVFKESEFAANRDALVRIVRMFDARGVRVVLLRTPFHHCYADYRPARWEALCAEALARVRDDPRLGHRVAYLDLMRHPDFVDADFRDDDHLNSAGAAKLAAVLERPITAMLDDAATRARIAGRTPGADGSSRPDRDRAVSKK